MDHRGTLLYLMRPLALLLSLWFFVWSTGVFSGAESTDTSFSASSADMTCENNILNCAGDAFTLNFNKFDATQVVTLTTTESSQSAAQNGSKGYLFYNFPVRMMDPSTGMAASFSTNFTFVIDADPDYADKSEGGGLVFVMVASESVVLEQGFGGGTFGVYGWNASSSEPGPGIFMPSTSQGISLTKTFGVEFDTFENEWDYDGNHVGMDLTSITSVIDLDANDVGITLASGKPVTAWIDYDFPSSTLEVRISNNSDARPNSALISYSALNLSHFIEEYMTVGFAASTGDYNEFHSVLRWSLETFWSNTTLPKAPSGLSSPSPNPLPGPLPGFAPSLLQGSFPPPGRGSKASKKTMVVAVSSVAAGGVFLTLVLICLGSLGMRCFLKSYTTKHRLSRVDVRHESSSDWMSVDIPVREFSYDELSSATDGFSEGSKLGEGASSSVYGGKLASSGGSSPSRTLIAVKKVAGNFKHRKEDFLAEISVVSKLRHRHVVTLLGWCTDNGNLLIVYELMPNGSLDKHLFPRSGSGADQGPVLTWEKRFSIVEGVAEALVYLHEGSSKQQAIHRDIKSSNVMLDEELNARVGDFGLARLLKLSETTSQMTNPVGTWGYMAPEVFSGKFSAKSDVYAFGALVLEIACGKRAFLQGEASLAQPCTFLVDWVWRHHTEGRILETADARLGGNFQPADMEHILLVGLLCMHSDPKCRPSMREVEKILDGHIPLPDVPLVRPGYMPETEKSFNLSSCHRSAPATYMYTRNARSMSWHGTHESHGIMNQTA